MMGTYEASVEESFKARHSLPLPDGSFEQAHEHEWRATASFRSRKLDGPMGVVIDFVQAGKTLKDIVNELDGADLSSVAGLAGGAASAERVAQWIASELVRRLSRGDLLYRLSVTEAPGCGAAYYPKGA
ncbi:MAG: 6-carboxytetrahydropterin synthase [Planctomycetes bacterium]|nr:6-carboxytetrahydropterin synthase [Planctomycetota bacterium]